MSELEVPDAACDALHACTGRERDDVRAIAAPVVAAELRRIAKGVDASMRYYLDYRASELEGGFS